MLVLATGEAEAGGSLETRSSGQLFCKNSENGLKTNKRAADKS